MLISFAIGCYYAFKKTHTTQAFEHLTVLDTLDKKLLAAGQDEMRKHKIIMCGIARDNAPDLPGLRKHFEKLGLLFNDYKVIIFENDSSDGTKEILKQWSADNTKVRILSKDFHLKKRPSIKFMADCRNFYIDAIRDHKEYDDFDIIMVVDMDMSYGFDIRAIQHSFGQIDRWDGICSNGIAKKCKMRDTFAFRTEEFPWHSWYGRPYLEKGKKIVPRRQEVFPINSNLVPVTSCFGGMAMYKRKAVIGCRYDSIDEDCEHIALHACMREKNNAKIFMNPAQLIRYTESRGRIPEARDCIK